MRTMEHYVTRSPLRSRGEPYYESLGDYLPKVPYTPTPETEPGTIRRRHETVVREAQVRLGVTATPEQIADDVCLPVWNVCRALGIDAPAKTPQNGDGVPTPKELRSGMASVMRHAEVVAKALAATGGLTMIEICRATGMTRGTVFNALRYSGRFRREGTNRFKKTSSAKRVVVWYNVVTEETKCPRTKHA